MAYADDDPDSLCYFFSPLGESDQIVGAADG